MKLIRSFLLLLAALTMSASVYAVEKAPDRGRIDLDGIWDFATDPENVGETQTWFAPTVALPTDLPEGYAPEKPGKIKVPGIWDAQGYGVPNDKVKHNFVGKGWYKRTFDVPKDWNPNNSVYLVLNGISRSAKVWIDGTQVGDEVVGCIGSFEFNVTPYITPGKTSTVAICVNSAQDWRVDPLLGAASLNDYLEIKWGGLWGHVYLESRPKTRLDSLYLRTKLTYDADNNPQQAACSVVATIIDETEPETLSGVVRLELYDHQRNCVGTAFRYFKDLNLTEGKADVNLETTVPNAKLWTPDTPYLYNVRVTFDPDDGERDVLVSTYGMRDIKFEGVRVYLNGKPFYLRGYGDDHIYPYEFSMSTDLDMYRKRLKLIKEFGFNHCRHHSCILPHEYYDACDELGMFPNGEMLLGYPQQLPGEGDLWKRNVPENADPTPANNTIKERWAAVVKEYRNHPSIFIWVGGNELCMLNWERWKEMPLGRELRDIAKELDPDRYFTDCDGDWLHELNRDGGGRDVQDFYGVLFDEWSNPVLNQEKFDTPVKFNKPFISHEAGNFLTFSRQDQVELFKGSNYLPFWMTEGKAKLDELGLADEVEDWAKASEQLYLLLHKYNVEGARKNEDLSGYHWWLIQDYWTTSNGIFDLFFRPKSLKPADILPFNSDLVLLQKGMKFSYLAGEEAQLELLISNFATSTKNGALRWSLTPANVGPEAADAWKALDNTVESVAAPIGKLTSVGVVTFTCPDVAEPTQVSLTLTYNADDETSYSNTWSTYIFPKTIAPTTQKTIYADDTTIDYFPEDWNVQPLASLSSELPADAVYSVVWVTPKVVNAVERGAGLIHFGGNQFLGSLPMRFQQTWWKAGDSETQNNTGTYVYPNALTDKIVEHNFCGAAWASLLDGAQKFSVETDQPRPEIFVRALSSLVRVRDAALLFEIGVGNGKIIVSGFNHEIVRSGDDAVVKTDAKPTESPTPINLYLLAQIIDEAASDEPAKVKWTAESIVPPVKVPAGFTLGVERFMKFAETGMWNSYREQTQSVPNWVCRQDKVGNDLVWRTSIVESTEAETVSFLFAGGTGFATTPKTEGYVLSFNGQDLLNFDVVENFDGTSQFVWKNEDGSASLTFDAKAELVPNDKYGLFTLTVPATLVKAGVAQEIGVRSLGEGSRRWFGVNLYTDFSDLMPTEAAE